MGVKILMMGCHMDAPGGISSVIKTYQREGIFAQGDVKYISTYKSSNKLAVIFNFLIAVCLLCINLIINPIEVVHVHSASRGSFWRKYLLLKIAKRFNAKVMFHLHSGEFPQFYEKQSIENKERIKRFLEDVDQIVVLSPYWRKKVLQIAPESNVSVLLNPVDKVNDEPKLQENHILFLGRLRKEKGIYELIAAAKILNEKGFDFKLTIAGDGDIESFQQLIDDSKLTKKIELVGWVSGKEKDDLILSSDLFVLPSYFEGLPISVLEAMINNVVVVATDVGGIPDVVKHKKTGLLVESKQSDQLASAIETLFVDEALKGAMRSSAYIFACESFQTKQIVSKLRSIYESI